MGVRVFISYRHSDSRHLAGRLRDRLADAFGEEHVFFDVESIGFGMDFREVIRSTLETVDVVLALVGPDFAPDRLSQTNDVVRLELTTAFDLQVPVIPVLVESATMPTPDSLPDDLERFAYLHAAPLRADPDFRPDTTRLIDSLTTTVEHRRASTPPAPDEPATERKPAARPLLEPVAAPAPVVGAPRLLERHHTKQVRGLAFTPDGTVLLSGGQERSGVLWDVATGSPRHVLAQPSWVFDVAVSPDGATAATASSDAITGTIRLWDTSTGTPLVTLGETEESEHHLGGVQNVAFTASGDTVVTGGGDKLVRTWRRADGELLLTFPAHDDGILALTCSPTEPLVATGGGNVDPTIRLWDPARGAPVATLEGHGGALDALAFSPDGHLLASGSGDGTVRVWDVAARRPLRTFSSPTRGPNAVAFSPDGRLVTSGTSEGCVQIWDWTIGSLVATLEDHSNWVRAVAFSPDGRLLASGGGGEIFRGDNQIRLWPLTP